MIKFDGNLLGKMIQRKKGQGMVEYGLIILLIATALVFALRTLGTQLSNFFSSLPF